VPKNYMMMILRTNLPNCCLCFSQVETGNKRGTWKEEGFESVEWKRGSSFRDKPESVCEATT
jgi:hypothetical protein